MEKLVAAVSPLSATVETLLLLDAAKTFCRKMVSADCGAADPSGNAAQCIVPEYSSVASTVMDDRVLVKVLKRIAGAGCLSRNAKDNIFIDTEVGEEEEKEKEDGEEDVEHCDCPQGDKESAPAPEQSVLSTQGSVQSTHKDGRAKADGAAEQRFTIH